MGVEGLRYRAYRLLKQTDVNGVYIDGGLGSQLFGMMLGLYRRRLDTATRIDTSYFRHGHTEPFTTASGLTLWPWELHRYGLHPQEFDIEPRQRPIRMSAEDQQAVDAPFLQGVLGTDWRSHFPLVNDTWQQLEALGIGSKDAFGAVHFRRGDYVQVSSRVVGLVEVASLLKRVRPLLPQTIIFVSDSVITPEDRETLTRILPDHDCRFPQLDEPHSLHGILRLARTLVTSNSTFSWTAGLLRERADSVVISPQHFFGLEKPFENARFQASSDWMFVGPSQ